MSKSIYLSPENRPKPHGPYAGYPEIFEHDYCCEIAEYEKTALERCGLTVTIAAPESGLFARCDEANAGGYNLYQTIHTNAGGGTGTECLYFGAPGQASYKANQAIYDELTKLYPSKRGLKDGNAYIENARTRMVSIYPELAFHDNFADAKFLVENKKQVAEALAKGVCAYLGIAYVAEAPVVPPPQQDKIYYVQIGAFKNKDNAQNYADQAKKDGYNAIIKEV